MIRHIVLWKFREDADPAPFLTGLQALKDQIDCIRDLRVTCSAVPDAAFDAVLEAEFDSLEDLDRYKNDPRHLAVSALCKQIRVSRAAIDITL